MRYTTQFEIPRNVFENSKRVDDRVEFYKEQQSAELGSLIADKVGWEENPYEKNRFVLDVQCFAQKDWRAFKQQLKEYVETANTQGLSTFNLIVIGKMLKELEEKGLTELENKAN